MRRLLFLSSLSSVKMTCSFELILSPLLTGGLGVVAQACGFNRKSEQRKRGWQPCAGSDRGGLLRVHFLTTSNGGAEAGQGLAAGGAGFLLPIIGLLPPVGQGVCLEDTFDCRINACWNWANVWS